MNSPLYRGAPFLRCTSHGLAGCYACNPSPSTPPVENSNPAGASNGADGQGVCPVQNKNPLGSPQRDKTGIRYVRKGCTVRFYGAYGRVLRVRKGQAYVDWAGGLKGDCIRCGALEVVAA